MQLYIRGQACHVIECEGNESIAQIKEQVAVLENLPVGELCLYCSGTPLEEDCVVANLQSLSLDVTMPLLGGKVHGSLARAGKVKGQTPKVEKQDKKRRRLAVPRDVSSTTVAVNVVQGFGRRRGPNANS